MTDRAIRHLALNFGHAEDQLTGWLLVSSVENTYPTLIAALHNFALELFEKYKEENNIEQTASVVPVQCCPLGTTQTQGFEFCPICGKPFAYQPAKYVWTSEDMDHFERFTMSLISRTCNELGSEFTAWEYSIPDIFSGPGSQVGVVNCFGEKALLMALLSVRPDIQESSGMKPNHWYWRDYIVQGRPY